MQIKLETKNFMDSMIIDYYQMENNDFIDDDTNDDANYMMMMMTDYQLQERERVKGVKLKKQTANYKYSFPKNFLSLVFTKVSSFFFCRQQIN